MHETGFSENHYQNPSYYILTDLWDTLEMTTKAYQSVKFVFPHKILECSFQKYKLLILVWLFKDIL